VAFKKLIAAAASVALIATPTMSLAQSSSPATTAATRDVAPAAEKVEGSELRGGYIIPLIALIAVILGLCAAGVICSQKDDLPHSP
jgi:hypothetical protein